jgi:hypothetical protein
LIRFHYLEVLPENFQVNSAMTFANQSISNSTFSMYGDWEMGFVGWLLRELGRDDLAQKQAYRECRATGTDGQLYVANYTDQAINGYHSIRPIYEESGDAALLSCMIKIKDYMQLIYNSSYGVYPQFGGSDEFWADAIGVGKPQFFHYMGEKLGDVSTDISNSPISVR